MNKPPTPFTNLSEILLQFRRTFKLKQYHVAELLSMAEKRYSAWERGKVVPHILTIEGIQARLRKYLKAQSNPQPQPQPTNETP